VLEQVLRGFTSDPLDLALVVTALFILVASGVGLQVYASRRRIRSRLEQSKKQYLSGIKQLSLDPSEQAILERMSLYLPNGESRRHLLLSSASLFDFCATKARKATDIDDGAMAALRLKLGFKPVGGEKPIRSTALLPRDIYLLVVQRETKKFYGKIADSTPQGLLLRIEDRSVIAPGAGTPVQCYFKSNSGTFSFSTRVSALADAHAIRIEHSETIRRSQRRKYYRAAMDLEARIRLAGSDEQPTPTRIVDLSGGGATAANPELRFRKGDDVQVVFRTDAGGEHSIVGEVVRLSDDAALIHVLFGPLADSPRDRLISFVLNQRNEKLN